MTSLQNTLKKPHKTQFQAKASDIQVTKSPWKTMDERGANTFPFHNLPPELKKTSLKVFPVLFYLSFWIKKNSVATLAIRIIMIKHKYPSQFSHCITELATLLGSF